MWRPCWAARPAPALPWPIRRLAKWTSRELPRYAGRRPIRWLEDDVRESQDVAAWVAAQNKVTFAFLERIPERERIRKRLATLWDFEKFSSPFKEGGRYYYYHNSGLQNQYVLCTMNSLDAEPQVLIDPNTWSKDGTVALDGTSFSDDGKYVAYGIQDGGSDWRTWRVMEIETGRVLDEELKWLKFSGTTWTKDGKGFFYSRYDAPAEGGEFQNLNLNQKVYYHRLGTSQADDVLVYRRPDNPDWGFDAEVTEDGRYLVITIWKGTDDKFRIVYRDLAEPYGMPVDLIETFDNEYTLVGNDGPVFFFKTDLSAPKRRLIAIDTRAPQREHWRELVPQSGRRAHLGQLRGQPVHRAVSEGRPQPGQLFSPGGQLVGEIELPGIGTASGFGGKRTDTETFYSFQLCGSAEHLPLRLDRSQEHAHPPLAGRLRSGRVRNRAGLLREQGDGTRVPMFITHKKDVARNGDNLTLLYGYGGFNIPMTPQFSISRLAWMELRRLCKPASAAEANTARPFGTRRAPG